jgi:flagellar FliJ protein
MAFRFSLATVLRVRESIEKREELALQRIQFEIAGVLRRIEELSAEITNRHNDRNMAMQQPVPAYILQSILSEVNEAIEKRQTLVDSLQMLEHERDKRKTAYHTAHTNRQMLTDMLTQQQNAHEQEQVRSQQKSIDEIFVTRSQRS